MRSSASPSDRAKAFALTEAGEERLTAFGVDLPAVRRSRRAFAPCCLDWSERRHHLAGALGAALLHRLLDLGWIVRTEASRAVKLTPQGRAGLQMQFGLNRQPQA